MYENAVGRQVTSRTCFSCFFLVYLDSTKGKKLDFIGCPTHLGIGEHANKRFSPSRMPLKHHPAAIITPSNLHKTTSTTTEIPHSVVLPGWGFRSSACSLTTPNRPPPDHHPLKAIESPTPSSHLPSHLHTLEMVQRTVHGAKYLLLCSHMPSHEPRSSLTALTSLIRRSAKCHLILKANLQAQSMTLKSSTTAILWGLFWYLPRDDADTHTRKIKSRAQQSAQTFYTDNVTSKEAPVHPLKYLPRRHLNNTDAGPSERAPRPPITVTQITMYVFHSKSSLYS
ncbi:hypothetical protein BU23DRAFT_244645 [Bimuria novae-zelandiae CBS 107.79]|uniref:Uncharacterized protein n=1 Tax=Bimuria novae-zelandiae CBS 107.79 TaxID=1447943 RepID=A0A6A5UW29_9PLEO|nr:hypothetical protein BU23DRAFT_244645 [Bimuria novae-zelandiae CBS 107.79]